MPVERRTKTSYKFEPEGNDRQPITHLTLYQVKEPERRRNERERWLPDDESPQYPAGRTELVTMSRRQVADLIADAADWLAWIGWEAEANGTG